MTALVFVDTNVFIYKFDARDPNKQRFAHDWIDHLWESNTGRISTQVLQEFYSVGTRKLKPGLHSETARRIVQSLHEWAPVSVDLHVMSDAWAIEDQYKLDWWDALIVASAKAANCKFLLSEDFQDELKIEGIEIVNPFSFDPRTLLE